MAYKDPMKIHANSENTCRKRTILVVFMKHILKVSVQKCGYCCALLQIRRKEIKILQTYFQGKLYVHSTVSCKNKRYLAPSSGLVKECDA